MKPAPCGKCDKKGCGSYHDICEKYVPWHEEREEMNRQRLKNREQRDYVKEQIEKVKRKKRR